MAWGATCKPCEAKRGAPRVFIATETISGRQSPSTGWDEALRQAFDAGAPDPNAAAVYALQMAEPLATGEQGTDWAAAIERGASLYSSGTAATWDVAAALARRVQCRAWLMQFIQQDQEADALLRAIVKE